MFCLVYNDYYYYALLTHLLDHMERNMFKKIVTILFDTEFKVFVWIALRKIRFRSKNMLLAHHTDHSLICSNYGYMYFLLWLWLLHTYNFLSCNRSGSSIALVSKLLQFYAIKYWVICVIKFIDYMVWIVFYV